MQDLLRSRRGLVVSAAVVILCIIGFFLATASNWRPFLNNTGQPVASAPTQPNVPAADHAASSPGLPPKPGTEADHPTVAAPGSQPAAADQSPVAPGTATPDQSTAGTAAGPSGPAAGPSASPSASQKAATGSTPSAGAPGTAPAGSEAQGAQQTGTSTPTGDGSKQGQTAAASGTGTGAPVPGTAPATSEAGSGPTGSAGSAAPSFDIIRVEPTGDSVIAARGAPNAEIDLLDGGIAIAHAKADANGQVAFLPPSLKPGEHSLMLSMKTPAGGQAVSSQSVAVSIPVQPKTAPMVALIQPNQPAAILSGPVAGGEPATPATTPAAPPTGTPASQAGPTKPAPPAEPPAIRSVEVESMGSFYAAGRALPGSKSRIYLNDAYVATVTAGPNGNWSLRINKGMKPGHYEVRADQVEPDGRVAARAQVPFDYPTQVASAAPAQEAAKKKSDAPLADATAPSQTGKAGPTASQTGANGAASADPRGGAPAGAADAQMGGAAGPTPHSAVGVGGGNSDAGSALAALGGADGAGSKAQAGATGPTASLPAAGRQPLPPLTASPAGASVAGTPAAGDATTDARPSASNKAATAGAARTETSENAGDDKGGPAFAQATGPVADAGGRPPATPGSPMRQGSPTASDDTRQNAGVGRPDEPHPPGTALQANATHEVGRPEASAGAADASSADADESPTVIEELVTAKVVHGDSLWRISRHMLGHGIRYTQIYAANTQQIRDPSLIYPGQVFVLPQE